MTRSFAFRLGLATSLLCLAGCAHVPPPEPIIRTQVVNVPVPQPCSAAQQLGPAPVYPDSDAALRAAPDLATRVGLLLAARLLRIARGNAAEAALAACAR